MKLTEIKKLIDKAQLRLEEMIEVQPKPALGKPSPPSYRAKIERSIWNVWDKLKAKGQFDAFDAKQIATGDNNPRRYKIDSSYSAVLSRWAKDGYINIQKQGTGPLRTIYTIPN